jgi:uncharacterized protein YndB with AHSA1/START domain
MTAHTASHSIAADSDTVFQIVTDPKRLPEWNRAIVRLIEAPEQLTTGSVWVVEVAALGQSWQSRSTVTRLDTASRRFSYRTQTDDGNPSYTDWSWRVEDAPGGCVVAVSLALNPATFWRRVLLAKIRGRQIRRRELPGSLDKLSALTARGAHA